MRIISKWFDYYDKIQGYGADQTVAYHRVARELDWPAYGRGKQIAAHPFHVWFTDIRPWNPSLGHGVCATSSYVEVPYEPFSIAFCGNIYRGLFISNKHQMLGIDRLPLPAVCCYSMDHLLETLDTFKIEEKCLYRPRFFVPTDRKALQSWFEPQHLTDLYEWSVENKLPIVAWSDTYQVWKGDYVQHLPGHSFLHQTQLVTNPCLKDFQFYRVKDAFTVYQELDMFISGVLGHPGVPLIEITDKDRIQQHGFDKWSFRKQGVKSKL